VGQTTGLLDFLSWIDFSPQVIFTCYAAPLITPVPIKDEITQGAAISISQEVLEDDPSTLNLSASRRRNSAAPIDEPIYVNKIESKCMFLLSD
jgi:hypothetical protein